MHLVLALDHSARVELSTSCPGLGTVLPQLAPHVSQSPGEVLDLNLVASLVLLCNGKSHWLGNLSNPSAHRGPCANLHRAHSSWVATGWLDAEARSRFAFLCSDSCMAVLVSPGSTGKSHWSLPGRRTCRRGTCVLTASRAAGDRYSPGVVGRECDRPGRKTTGSRCGPRIESALCPRSARQVQKVQASMSSSSTIRSSSPMEYCAPAWQKRAQVHGRCPECGGSRGESWRSRILSRPTTAPERVRRSAPDRTPTEKSDPQRKGAHSGSSSGCAKLSRSRGPSRPNYLAC